MLRALERFPGRVLPINPRGSTVEGRESFPTVSSAPAGVDLAILCVPAEALPAALTDCAAAGVGAALICTGGLGESGPAGAAIEAKVTTIAAGANMRLLGPNTSGFLNPARGLYASFVTGAAAVPAGKVAVVAQSGGVNLHISFSLARKGLGVSLAVGLGNAADVGAADVVNYLAADASTSVVLLALEGVRDGEELCAAIERTVDRKPVVVLKVGTADHASFAQSHTGALAGNDAVARDALRQAGAVLVDSTEHLVAAARVLATTRLEPRSSTGVGVVSGQAGPALILADALTRSGLTLPALSDGTRAELDTLLPPLTYKQNPVDTGRPGPTFGPVLEAVGRDSAIDVVVVYAIHEPEAIDAPLVLARARETTHTPAVFVTNGPLDEVLATASRLEAAAIPTFNAPEEAVAAIAALAADAEARMRRTVEAPTRAGLSAAPAPLFDEAAAKTLLEECGIRTPRREVHTDRAAIDGIFERLAVPLVVKILDATVVHKSDVGGVRIGIRTEADLLAALDAIDRVPGGTGAYLIEEQSGDGVELIAGGRRDPSFGAIVMVGLGGVATEALGDVAFRRAPLTPSDARDMIGSLRAARLLDGFRGLPAIDRGELAAILVTLGELLTANQWIAEVDINPLRATTAGLIALDALIVPTL
jgi:acetyltransferase